MASSKMLAISARSHHRVNRWSQLSPLSYLPRLHLDCGSGGVQLPPLRDRPGYTAASPSVGLRPIKKKLTPAVPHHDSCGSPLNAGHVTPFPRVTASWRITCHDTSMFSSPCEFRRGIHSPPQYTPHPVPPMRHDVARTKRKGTLLSEFHKRLCQRSNSGDPVHDATWNRASARKYRRRLTAESGSLVSIKRRNGPIPQNC